MYMYVVILPEHAQLAEPVLGPWSGEVIDGLAIYADISATWKSIATSVDALEDLGIAFNMGYYSKAIDFVPTRRTSFRVDHTGAKIKHLDGQSTNNDPDGTRRQLLHQKLDLKTRDIDRIANVLYLRDSWDHQVEYGKLYRMMKLIGATE